MKKIIKMLGLGLLMSSTALQAQVKFQLTMLPDKKSYLVSMVSSKTWTYPQNLTSTAQVTIKVPSDKPFTAVVTNLNPNVKWSDNSYIEQPASDPAHNYISFGLVSLGTSKLEYKENEELPLFIFKNMEADPCVGKISLLDNVKDALKGKEAETYNISNQISVYAVQGDVYSGNLLSDVDCSSVTSNADLFGDTKVSTYPIPSTDIVNIEWAESSSGLGETTLVVENADGQVVLKKAVTSGNGTNKEILDVNAWMSGYYHYYFIKNKISSKKYKFIVVK